MIDNSSGPEPFTVAFAAGKGYDLQKEIGKYVTVDERENVQITSIVTYFKA